MSFLYDVGDKIVAVTWRSRDRRTGASNPIHADVLERKPPDSKSRFPMYRVRLHMPRGKPIEDWISEHGILSMASEFVSPTYRYYQVLAHEPLLTYFRTPLPSLRWPSVRKAILSAMAAVHRVKPKDVIEILSIDGTEDADQAGLVRTLVRAYDGDPSSVPMAALYDWYDDHFTLVRRASESKRA